MRWTLAALAATLALDYLVGHTVAGFVATLFKQIIEVLP